MEYSERLENVTILGAAGKMGSGILLLTAMEMADLSLKPENKNKVFALNAVDVSHHALKGVMKFLQIQVRKAAEKKILLLRKLYKDQKYLVENSDIIEQYIFDVLSVVRPTTNLASSYESNLIFEAIIENPELKVKIITQIEENSQKSPWYFTNTSSIPIHYLNQEANLKGRIIGFHFYNPPAVQKLVELISTGSTLENLADFAKNYAKNLSKTIVPANDIAGFIGNGHFIRDILYAISEVEALSKEMPTVEAIYMINKVSQEFLIRPMGIFQLIDYVGLDVCQFIMDVMNAHIKDEEFHSDFLDHYLKKGIKGGQKADASQKDGFLKYEKGKPTGVFDAQKGEYASIDTFNAKCEEKLGPLTASAQPWKSVISSPEKNEILDKHFKELNKMQTKGAKLAMAYGKRSMEIAKKLVSNRVANSDDDVNTVLKTGFFHAYGAINNFFNRK